MKKIRIFCEKTFLFQIQGNNYYIDNNNFLEIDSSQKIIVMAYPIEQDKNSLPFCFVINQENNKIECNSNNIKIYNLKNRYDIFVEQFLLTSQNVVFTSSCIVKNTRYTLVCYDDRIKIYCNSGEYVFYCKCNSATSDCSNNCINIMCENSQNKTYVRFDTQSKKFCSVCGDKIQIEEEIITTQTNTNNSLGHIVITKYKNDTTLTQQEQEIYSNEEIQNCSVQQIIPYKFLEAISQKDFTTAKKYLADNILTKISFDDICEYFGNFNKIEVLSLSPLVYTLYGFDNAKDYIFEMQNNKIFDIDEI